MQLPLEAPERSAAMLRSNVNFMSDVDLLAPTQPALKRARPILSIHSEDTPRPISTVQDAQDRELTPTVPEDDNKNDDGDDDGGDLEQEDMVMEDPYIGQIYDESMEMNAIENGANNAMHVEMPRVTQNPFIRFREGRPSSGSMDRDSSGP